jgi:hypothetical protein
LVLSGHGQKQSDLVKPISTHPSAAKFIMQDETALLVQPTMFHQAKNLTFNKNNR